MALTNYSELQTAIADFLNRDDLTAVIPTFISLAEGQINRQVRHWRMENRATSTINEQYLTRPSDWLETIRMTVDGAQGVRQVELISRAALADKRAQALNTSGEPRYYTNSEDSYELYPTPDGDYNIEVLYTQKVPALSVSNTTNWLLTDHPDVYLYGALVHSAPYLQEDGRAATWAQMYGAAVQAVNLSSEKAKYSGSGLTPKIRGLA